MSLNAIKRSDYINDEVRENAIRHSLKIQNMLEIVPTNYNRNIKKKLMNFYNETENQLDNKVLNVFKRNHFTDDELKYLETAYLKGEENNLEVKDYKKYYDIKKSLFKKLSVNSWFNAIREAFNLNILDKEKYRVLDLNKKSREFCKSNSKIYELTIK